MPKYTGDDPLHEEYFNQESIEDFADAFDLSYDEAVIVWCRFVGTVDKLREVTKRLRSSGAAAMSEKGASQP